MNIKSGLLDAIRAEAETSGIPCISPSTGRLLEMLVSVNRSANIVEIGSGNGYSALFLLRGMESAGAGRRVTTFEKDPKRFEAARKNLEEYIETGIVKAFHCDVLENLDKIEGNIDFLFIDGMKRQYRQYLEVLFPSLVSGAVIFSDDIYFQGVLDPQNTLDRHKTIVKGLREYLKYLEELEKSGLIKNYFFNYENGLSISYKI